MARRRRADNQRASQKTHAGERASDNRQITAREVEDIEERSSPRTPVIYEIVRRLGEEEMGRPATSLWWSGLAGGLSISFSLLASGEIQSVMEAVLGENSKANNRTQWIRYA
jgi:hypothetical protein